MFCCIRGVGRDSLPPPGCEGGTTPQHSAVLGRQHSNNLQKGRHVQVQFCYFMVPIIRHAGTAAMSTGGRCEPVTLLLVVLVVF